MKLYTNKIISFPYFINVAIVVDIKQFSGY